LEKQFPKATATLAAAEVDVCAYATFSRAHWRKIASTNPLERINKEIKRRSNVVGIFPYDDSVIRLVGAVLIDQHDDWQATDRRYLSKHSMALIDDPTKEVTTSTTPNELAAAQPAQRKHRGSHPHFHHVTGHGLLRNPKTT
jgi:putative transposase